MTTQKQYIKWAEEEIKRLEQDVKGERAKTLKQTIKLAKRWKNMPQIFIDCLEAELKKVTK